MTQPMILLVAALLMGPQVKAELWLSETDNVRMQLHQAMYPVSLNFTQNTHYGVAKVTNQSFQDELGKYELILVDWPITDPRTALQRIDQRLTQIQRSPHTAELQSQPRLNADLPQVRIDWLDGSSPRLEYLFVDGLREYHFRAESFSADDWPQVSKRLQSMAESFGLATAPASYYAAWNSRQVDASLTPALWPDWHQQALSIANQALAANPCGDAKPLTPAALILEANPQGQVQEAFSSPRGVYGRCLEMALIGLQLPPPPANQTLRLYLAEQTP